MKSLYLFATMIFIAQFAGKAQGPVNEEWHVYHDGSIPGADKANALLSDPAGNIYVTGICFESTDKGQFTTIKYDTAGNVLWVSDYNGASTTKANRGNEIAITDNGTVYAVGITSDKGGDIGILKYNSDSMVWAESFTPSWFGNYSDEGIDIDVDGVGNAYAIGRVTSTSGSLDDTYTIKVDENGNLVWEKLFSENSATDYPAAISVTNSGHVFSLTSSFNFWGSANFDITTIYYDDDGVEQWISRYNGGGNDMDVSMDIIATENDTQFVCGSTLAATGDYDYVMMMQNEYGTRLWTEFYNGTANQNDTAFAIQYLNDGRAVVTGKSIEAMGGDEIEAATTLLIGVDGSILWIDVFTGDENFGAAAKSIAVDSLNGIYVSGYVLTTTGEKDGLLIKYNAEGEQEWNQIFDSEEHLADAFNDITIDNNLNIILTGQSFNSGTESRYLTVKYSQEIEIEDTTGNGGEDTTNTGLSNSDIDELIVFPNPAQNEITLQIPSADANLNLYIYDITGKLCVFRERINITHALNIDELKAGIYFIHLTGTENDYTGRFYKLE